MVRRSFIGFIYLPILLLSSCGSNQEELRSDIAQFITSFSVDESIKAYQEAGYLSTREMYIDGVSTVEIEKVDFNIKDMKNMTYLHTLDITEDGELTTSRIQKIEVVDTKYMYTLDDSTSEVDLDFALSIINTFFYLQEPVEGYRVRGMYYGDYVKETALIMQNAVTIDTENDLYVESFRQVDESIGMDITMTFKVNRLGMLEVNEQKFINKSNWIEQTITVYRK